MADSGDLSYWLKRHLTAFEEKFSKADKDKNGSLSYSEISNVLRDAGFKGTDEDMEAIFKFADTNKDSKISRNEYIEACKKAPKIALQEILLRRAFKKLDKDGNGFLSRAELLEAVASEEAGLIIPATKLSEMIIALVADQDHKFSYEEFLEQFRYNQTATLLRDRFNFIDKDKSGFLSRAEIMDAIKSDAELSFSAATLSQLLVSQCKDQQININYEEFAQAVERQSKK